MMWHQRLSGVTLDEMGSRALSSGCSLRRWAFLQMMLA